jgi:glycosyltransferase involved in cell wall biosynthesis
MSSVINLSYVLTTRNRLPFLEITLQKLLDQLQPDEEVVVVDADSTDGTQQYLSRLLEEGKIHQYLSEKDRNQAHGWNKAMLMAKGTLIKKIIDDDVFCYNAIRQCKTHMLKNPQIDVVISNDLSSRLNDYKTIEHHSRLSHFEKWRGGTVKSFPFGDVHMVIRRTSLAYIGLYNTSFTMMDWEYSLRISYNKARIAYYTGYNALSVGHLQTVSSQSNKQRLQADGKRGETFYEYSGDGSDIGYWSKIKIWIGKIVYKQNPVNKLSADLNEDITPVYNHYYAYIEDINNRGNFTFLTT